MDKISSLPPNIPFHPAAGDTAGKKTEKNKKKPKTAFRSLLDSSRSTSEAGEASGVVSDEEFQTALDKVFDLGEELKRNPVLSVFQEYRRNIRNVFKYIMKHSLDVEKQTGIMDLKTMKPPKEYTLVKVVDRKLEDLAAFLLRSQRSQLEIVDRVDEIQGLIIDLTK